MLGLTFLWDFVLLDTSYAGIPDYAGGLDHMPLSEIRDLDPKRMEIAVGHYYICHYHKDENDT